MWKKRKHIQNGRKVTNKAIKYWFKKYRISATELAFKE